MRSSRYLPVLTAIILLACQAVSLGRLRQITPTAALSPVVSPIATSTTSPAIKSTASSSLPAIPVTGETAETANASHARSEANDFSVRLHPDGDLVVGDLVSLEVVAPAGFNAAGYQLHLQAGDLELGPYDFEQYGLAGRTQATLLWVWDTRSLPAGWQTLTFSIRPDGPVWTQTVYLGARASLPESMRTASWKSAETACCWIYYLSGTEAERDLDILLAMADDAAQLANQRMQTAFKEKVPVVILPRVLGHGGFASQEIAISYLDRNYAGGDRAIVLLHEMIHVLDSQLGGELRPALLVEGLAVYLSGGHFKREAILPRAAVLLETGGFVPLNELADNFYPAQHETGYLQAGALVAYMVERWGWRAYNAFYRDIHPDPGGGGARRSIDTALQKHFKISLKRLEVDFLDFLRTQTVDDASRQDLRLTLQYYDCLRRYQRLLDPSAFYLTAWLPDSQQMRERAIAADYLRRPGAPHNILIETLLLAADQHLRQARYAETDELLKSTNLALDAIERQQKSVLNAD